MRRPCVASTRRRRAPRTRPTTQVQNVVKILGLRFGTYTQENIKTLRYGHLMIMTDQDHDGYRAASLRSRGRSRDLKLPSPNGKRHHAPRAVDAPLALPRDAVAATDPPRAVDAPRAAPTKVPHQGLTDQLPPPLLAPSCSRFRASCGASSRPSSRRRPIRRRAPRRRSSPY